MYHVSLRIFLSSFPYKLASVFIRRGGTYPEESAKDNFPDLNFKEAKLGTLFERGETLCQMLLSQIETTDVNERHKLWNLLPAKRGPCNHERRHKRVYSLPLIKTNRFKNHLLCTMQPRPLDSSNFVIIFIVCI